MRSHLEDTVSKTEFVSNPFADEMHPFRSPVEFAPVSGAYEALELFEEMVSTIVEGDYGDFMRRAQGYYLEMIEELGPHAREVRDRLDWIEEYLQFRPNWDIDSTRARLLVD